MLRNIYTPNKRQDLKDFWEGIELERQQAQIGKLDYILGDFNVTEDTIEFVSLDPT